ncbi:unnamed protein product [Pleuronectes platessa]|uniref:Uncharacterized protein n=1 Tax=Pleuronectes platessa TaxID=8262 RepID=A0A9N7Z4Z0_PLEPL|nr:unnamed protein product [Pleuronectes platessa]
MREVKERSRHWRREEDEEEEDVRVLLEQMDFQLPTLGGETGVARSSQLVRSQQVHQPRSQSPPVCSCSLGDAGAFPDLMGDLISPVVPGSSQWQDNLRWKVPRRIWIRCSNQRLNVEPDHPADESPTFDLHIDGSTSASAPRSTLRYVKTVSPQIIRPQNWTL